MSAIFDFIGSSGLSQEKYMDTITSWKGDDIERFAADFIELAPAKEIQPAGPFDFISSSQLSGEPCYCGNYACRMQQAFDLSQFAALYANTVFIRNPLEKYYPMFEEPSDITRINLFNDIAILHKLKPLIDAGLIQIVSAGTDFCIDCYNKYCNEAGLPSGALERIKDVLMHRYVSKAELSFSYIDDIPKLYIDGLDDLSHTSSIRYGEIPSYLLPYLKRARHSLIPLKKRDKVYQQAIDHTINSSIIRPIIEDLVMQSWYSTLHGVNYLTDRDVDLDLMSVVNDRATNIVNRKMTHALSHAVPIIGEVDLERLVKLRKEEGEAFNVYREAVYKVVSTAEDLTEKEIGQALDDLIRPEINNIELTIKNSRKILQDSTKKDVLLLVGFISMALCKGILPNAIPMEVISMLGGAKTGLELLLKTTDYFKESPDIRNNKFYFVWKANNKLGRKSRWKSS